MRPISTLTMNPAVDVCAAVDRVLPVHKLRCAAERRDAGGGGINVARVVRRLGGAPIALFPAGGPIGQLLEQLISAEDVNHIAVPIAGGTREDFTIDENATGAQFRFVMPGPKLSETEIQACLDTLAANVGQTDFVVASGSLPLGVPGDFYHAVARIAAKAGAKFVLDSSGPALKSALGSGVYLIKPNLREFNELVGKELGGRNDYIDAARQIISGGAVEMIALTLGEGGALLVTRNFVLSATAPPVAPVSTVGAGDSFLGALVYALARGESHEEALALAVAAGSAALLSRGTDLCHAENIHKLRPRVQVERL